MAMTALPAEPWKQPLVIGTVTAVGVAGLVRYLFTSGATSGQNLASFLALIPIIRGKDYRAFMESHRRCLATGQKTRNFTPGVMNYYEIMSEVITTTCGPYWHFVPMHFGMSRAQSHEKFHHTITEFLGSKPGDRVLELGCGFGEMGRQVAKLSGSSVVGLTMADCEVAGANERIKAANLESLCTMVQGDYHNLPFEDQSFDQVFGVYTLKYSAALEKAVSEAARVLKPGGTFLSYEILVTDAYDESDPWHKYLVQNISDSTCMPPLHSLDEFREAAARAGLKPMREEDVCEGARPWYTCFTRSGVHLFLLNPLLRPLIRLAELLRIVPLGFTDFYSTCLFHPTTDFVRAGRLGIISGAIMMTWTKPQ